MVKKFKLSNNVFWVINCNGCSSSVRTINVGVYMYVICIYVYPTPILVQTTYKRLSYIRTDVKYDGPWPRDSPLLSRPLRYVRPMSFTYTQGVPGLSAENTSEIRACHYDVCLLLFCYRKSTIIVSSTCIFHSLDSYRLRTRFIICHKTDFVSLMCIKSILILSFYRTINLM